MSTVDQGVRDSILGAFRRCRASANPTTRFAGDCCGGSDRSTVGESRKGNHSTSLERPQLLSSREFASLSVPLSPPGRGHHSFCLLGLGRLFQSALPPACDQWAYRAFPKTLGLESS